MAVAGLRRDGRVVTTASAARKVVGWGRTMYRIVRPTDHQGSPGGPRRDESRIDPPYPTGTRRQPWHPGGFAFNIHAVPPLPRERISCVSLHDGSGLSASLILSLCFASQDVTVGGAPPSSVEFNRDIRPILSDHCFQCHGPDGSKRKAKLRLDLEESARGVLGRKGAVPGELDASELYRRITSEDDSERMPPPIERQGPLRRPGPEARRVDQAGRALAGPLVFRPTAGGRPHRRVKQRDWVRNPIDAFVLARLEREGLEPSPEEGRGGLLRRLSFDLTGLPPSPSELDAFESDPRPDAYERVVDRLLASPRFGERMAIRWLNAARYADTSGYQTDGERVMWRWRDWVIEAYNRNLPYDRVHDRSARRRPDRRCHARPEDRHRLQPQPPRQFGGGDHPRGVCGRVRRRSRRDDRDRLARPDHRLRPLPQPQVRPGLAGGVLPALRLLQQRPRERPGGQVRQLAPVTSSPPRRPSRSNWPRSTSSSGWPAARAAAVEASDRTPRPAGKRRSRRSRDSHGRRGNISRRVSSRIAIGRPRSMSGRSATSARSASWTGSRSPPGSAPTGRRAGRSSPAWSTSRGARVIPWSSTTGRSRSTW